MFTKEFRNKRLRTAYKRNVAAQLGAVAAKRAIDKAERTEAEIRWLKESPVSDGKPGEDLPTDEEIKAIQEAELARLRKARSRKTQDTALELDDQSPVYDEDGNVI